MFRLQQHQMTQRQISLQLTLISLKQMRILEGRVKGHQGRIVNLQYKIKTHILMLQSEAVMDRQNKKRMHRQMMVTEEDKNTFSPMVRAHVLKHQVLDLFMVKAEQILPISLEEQSFEIQAETFLVPVPTKVCTVHTLSLRMGLYVNFTKFDHQLYLDHCIEICILFRF